MSQDLEKRIAEIAAKLATYYGCSSFSGRVNTWEEYEREIIKIHDDLVADRQRLQDRVAVLEAWTKAGAKEDADLEAIINGPCEPMNPEKHARMLGKISAAIKKNDWPGDPYATPEMNCGAWLVKMEPQPARRSADPKHSTTDAWIKAGPPGTFGIEWIGDVLYWNVRAVKHANPGFDGEGFKGEMVVISCRQCGAQHHVTMKELATGKYDPPPKLVNVPAKSSVEPVDMESPLLVVGIDNGKYTVVQQRNGRTIALRHGEPWRDCVGDGLILGLAYRIEELSIELAKYQEKSTPDDTADLRTAMTAAVDWPEVGMADARANLIDRTTFPRPESDQEARP